MSAVQPDVARDKIPNIILKDKIPNRVPSDKIPIGVPGEDSTHENSKRHNENVTFTGVENQIDMVQLQSLIDQTTNTIQNSYYDPSVGSKIDVSKHSAVDNLLQQNGIDMSKKNIIGNPRSDVFNRLQNQVDQLRTNPFVRPKNTIDKLISNSVEAEVNNLQYKKNTVTPTSLNTGPTSKSTYTADPASTSNKDSTSRSTNTAQPTPSDHPSTSDPSSDENAASTCSFYPPVFNKTIMGGLRRREEVKQISTGDDPDTCAAKCCRRENCKAAVIYDNKCYAVQCRTRGYCDGHDDAGGGGGVIVYLKSRDGETLDRRERCRRHCGSGACVNDDTCVCDTGVIGEHCESLEPRCAVRCGRHGTCDAGRDTCVCEEGWEGAGCDTQTLCDPPCKNGTCVDAYTNACKCNPGWSGVYCHETANARDTHVMASTGEQVLFTQAEVEPELAIKVPADKPPLSERAEPVSAFTVAACCACASLFLGVVVVIGMMKQIVNKRNAMTREYLEKAQLIH